MGVVAAKIAMEGHIRADGTVFTKECLEGLVSDLHGAYIETSNDGSGRLELWIDVTVPWPFTPISVPE